ncbi:DinB family protein [Saccharopolyspora oryzae]|uniref:DinB family protein n=1 Tax=Saccharopolyspora oryzae TaxID=2997343 RepID=A0ABT4V5K6_9PSEU|nr:DinB family protein [Saccharopolyspora oryzae]MDA3629228.1 DinB family protein [Saccharopolyspora oryzae]
MPNILSGERADILELLRTHRGFLRYTVQNLTEEQARSRPTKSEFSLSVLIKHVTSVERNWADFIRNGRKFDAYDEAAFAEMAATFQVTEEETLEALLAEYEEVARKTDEIVETVPDLDLSHLLPDAPWSEEKGKRWTIRRVLLHIAAETAQHAGHADIIRETIDGQKTMG